ncbi:MAG TPA: hypothetical protein VND87_19695 [Stellaceae bacterium]|nr:hypothetical protein [Stellaceae bacterium]
MQWVQPGAMVSGSAHEPAEAIRRNKPNRVRLEPVDIVSILLVVAIIASGIVASVWAVQQYRWEQAAYAAFKARHIHDIVVPPVFDWPGRERLVGQMVGGAGILILELVAGLVLRRHARAISRGERPERKPRPRRRVAQVVVRETFRPAATEAKSRPAAERAATVIWGDRVARHEAAPHGN